MLNLPEVEKAKALMTEAAARWSVMRWIAEKKKVRKAADLANDALDALDESIKSSWSDELKAAYDEFPPTGIKAESLLTHDKDQDKGKDKGKEKKISIDPEIRLLAKAIKQADEEAYRAHMDAEDTFDRAEKRLSTSMAREGSRKAILSWELHEKAIIKSKAAVDAGKAAL
jgi:hypothetical protein